MRRYKYEIAAVYDTETCNIKYFEGKKEVNRAYPILFIDNDIRGVNLEEYEVDKSDKIYFYRYVDEMLERIDTYILWGEMVGKVPIILAYNLMFDLQPLIYSLNSKYEVKVSAQTSTNVYTLDLIEGEKTVLRFWDMFFLELRGVEAMGITCGIEKATGGWDYNLIRTPETPLTEDELFYAKRDVQVLPAYLKWLLKANEWLEQKDFGVRLLTKTGLVRQMARRNIGRIKVGVDKKISVDKIFTDLCKRELPYNFDIYALRKSCFRGGLTFTSARYANTIQRDVISMDVVSMHHTYINGREIPVKFNVAKAATLQYLAEDITNLSLEDVLKDYSRPFPVGLHIRVKFKNIRLKENSAFEHYGIGILASAKFKRSLKAFSDFGMNETSSEQENYVRELGWHDTFDNATFAFSKLYKADNIVVHVSEHELWAISRVYSWDDMTVLGGEVAYSFIKPPYFVSLQSNILFKQKSSAKFVYEHYNEGESYKLNLSDIPEGIAAQLRSGTCDKQFFYGWYTNTVKGQYNGIYGTQAQDIYKPDFMCSNGEITVDSETKTTEENWEKKQPKTSRVLYNYGMRIVAGSRVHMIIAIEMLYNKFGENIHILGGDTDSIKAAVNGLSDDEIEKVFEPLNKACDDAILYCQKDIRKLFGNLASDFKDVGHFEIENSGNHYDKHLELWNKARVSWNGKTHITMAGISRPSKKYNIETFLDELINAGYSVEDVYMNCVKYNNVISNEISYALEIYKPKACDKIKLEVTDYLGESAFVDTFQSKALYPINRVIGDTTNYNNSTSIKYLKDVYSRDVDAGQNFLTLEGGKAALKAVDENGKRVTVMKG